MKRILSILLATMMVLGLCVTAFAADKPGPVAAPDGKTVTIMNNESGHTYEAYQIFETTLEKVTTTQAYDLTRLKRDNNGASPSSSDYQQYWINEKGDIILTEKKEGTAPNQKIYLLDDSGKYVAELTVEPVEEDTTVEPPVAAVAAVAMKVNTIFTNTKFGANLNHETKVDGKTFVEALQDAFSKPSEDKYLWNPADFDTSANPTFDQTKFNAKFDTDTEKVEEIVKKLGEIDETRAPELADVISKYIQSDPYASTDTHNGYDPERFYKLTGLAEGYYFIKDMDDSLPATEYYSAAELDNFVHKADGYYEKAVTTGLEYWGRTFGEDDDVRDYGWYNVDKSSPDPDNWIWGDRVADEDGAVLPLKKMADNDGKATATVPNSYTNFILRVVDDVKLAAKADTPSIEKKILEVYDPATGDLMQVKGYFDEIDSNVDESLPDYKHNYKVATVPYLGDLLYHQRSLIKDFEGKTNYPLLYWARNVQDTDFVPDTDGSRKITTTVTGYPVFTTEAFFTDPSDNTIRIDNPPVYRNAKGDVYTLRVDENTASVGQYVKYEIKGKVPNMEGYDKYYYIMTDTLSKGLTLPADFVTTSNDDIRMEVYAVYADGAKQPLMLVEMPSLDSDTMVLPGEKIVYYITDPKPPVEGQETTIKLVFNDFIQYKNDWVQTLINDKGTPETDDDETVTVNHGKPVEMVVTYSVQVNKNALVGNPGNPNAVDLTYSRDPNKEHDGENTNNEPSAAETDIIGTTPKSEVRTYVTEILLRKTDEDGKPLSGAKFDVVGTRSVPTVNIREEYLPWKDANNDNKDDDHPEVTKDMVVFYKLKAGTWTDKAPTFDDYTPSPNVGELGTITYGNYHEYEGYTGTVTPNANGVNVPNPAYGVYAGEIPYPSEITSENFAKDASGTDLTNDYTDFDFATSYAAALTTSGIGEPKYYHYIETTVEYKPDGTHYLLNNGTYTDVNPNLDNTSANFYENYADWDGATTYEATTLAAAIADEVFQKKYYVQTGLEVGKYGTLNLAGLGTGLYTLTETKAPEDFNLLHDKIYVKIEFRTDDNSDTNTLGPSPLNDEFIVWYKQGGDPTIDPNASPQPADDKWIPMNTNGSGIVVDHQIPVEGDVHHAVQPVDGANYFWFPLENKQGSELPETGGFGTKMFIALGVAMAAVAGVVLVTRRRMAADLNR